MAIKFAEFWVQRVFNLHMFVNKQGKNKRQDLFYGNELVNGGKYVNGNGDNINELLNEGF